MDFMQCRYRWYCKWVLNRVPRNEARALGFGKLLHLVFEDHLLSGDPMSVAIKRQRAKWLVEADVAKRDIGEATAALNAIADLDSYTEVLEQWTDAYPFDTPTLEVETPFELESPFDPSIVFRGRPDRVGILFGRTVHVQNRSLAQGTNFDLYCHLAKRHLHELVYGYALSKKYTGQGYGGTLFNLLRKVAYRGKTGKILRPLSECLWQGFVNYSSEELEAGVKRATLWANEMWNTTLYYHTKEHILPNEKLNAGFYGNALDPYFLVLQNEIKLDDDRYFKDRTDTYA